VLIMDAHDSVHEGQERRLAVSLEWPDMWWD